jgi:hypothetical protein
MYRTEINILRKVVHQVGFIYNIIQGWAIKNKNKKIQQRQLCEHVRKASLYPSGGGYKTFLGTTLENVPHEYTVDWVEGQCE